ncbi:MAG: VanZ family protein [Archaeoglobaceae archaeon]
MHTGKIVIALTVIYAGFIFYLSSQSDPSSSLEKNEFIVQLYMAVKSSEFAFLAYPIYPATKYPDKFLHVAIYGIFGILLHASFRYRHPVAYSSLLAIVVGFLYGITDEFHQSFVPGRTASLWDLTADIIGLLLAQIVIFIVLIIKKRRNLAESGK